MIFVENKENKKIDLELYAEELPDLSNYSVAPAASTIACAACAACVATAGSCASSASTGTTLSSATA